MASAPPRRVRRATGCLTALGLVVAAALSAWWALWMSWSHSYAAPAFRAAEQRVFAGIGACLLAAMVCGLLWASAPRGADDHPT